MSVDPISLNVEKLKDSLSNPQKLNGYTYTLNNPLKYIDPSGNTEVEFWMGLFMGAAQSAVGVPMTFIHPIQTTKELASTAKDGYYAGKSIISDLTANPSQAINEIKQGVALEVESILNASDYEQGRVAGSAGFNTALAAGIIGKAGNLETYSGVKSTVGGVMGERFGISVERYQGAKGVGITLRDINKSPNYNKTRLIGLDIHDVQLGGSRIKVPHVDADIKFEIFNKEVSIDLHHWPWERK